MSPPSSLTFNILLFGITREIVGQSTLEITLSTNQTVADLLAELRRRYPALATLRSLAVAINSEYAVDTEILQANDEIALIPPVAGG
jgi:molybdopterin synthase sulfur carrier subunit